MNLPIAIATTATERAARRRRPWLAIRAGLLTAGVLLAGLCVAPVPRWCLDAVGAPRGGVERLGGLRARWLAPETAPDAAKLQRRLARRGLTATVHTYGPLVIAEIPGMPEVDTRDALQLLRGPAVEIHKLGPGGVLDRGVLFDRTQIQSAAVTSMLGDVPRVAFMIWMPPGSTRGPRVPAAQVAITVDHHVRWTAQFWQLAGEVFVLDTDGDRDGLAEALDDDPLHGGTIVDLAYVSALDLAHFAWAARAAAAITGGVAAALIGLLLSAGSARLRRRKASPIAGMRWGAEPERTPV